MFLNFTWSWTAIFGNFHSSEEHDTAIVGWIYTSAIPIGLGKCIVVVEKNMRAARLGARQNQLAAALQAQVILMQPSARPGASAHMPRGNPHKFNSAKSKLGKQINSFTRYTAYLFTEVQKFTHPSIEKLTFQNENLKANNFSTNNECWNFTQQSCYTIFYLGNRMCKLHSRNWWNQKFLLATK